MIEENRPKFDRILVVGGGVMGRGIAWTAALQGLKVIVEERDAEGIEEMKAAFVDELDAEIARWGLTEGEKRAILARTVFRVESDNYCDVPFVIETITEPVAAKMRVYTALDKRLPDTAVIAANPAAFSVTDLARHTRYPARFVGVRFALPVPHRTLVEVIRGHETSQETFERTCALAKALSKTPVEVFESPGAITIRGIVPLLNEAMHMLMEGIGSAADIDTAMKLGFQLSEGPLALADRIGLDRVLSWMEHMTEETYDPKYRPCPLLKKLVRAGKLGVESGEGFFQHPQKTRE